MIKKAFRTVNGFISRSKWLIPVVKSTFFLGGERISKNARLFQLETASPLPSIRLGDLIGEHFPSAGNEGILLLPTSNDGSPLWFETVLLATLIKLIKPQAILEFGTYRGRTTWHLFHNAPQNAMVYTIDLPNTDIPDDITDKGLAFEKTRDYLPVSERVMQILVDTQQWDGMLPEKVQFVFIDASHRYDDVKNDTQKALGCLDEVACVCWHDCLWQDDGYGVYLYLAELRAVGYNIFRIQQTFESSSIAIWMTPKCAELLDIPIP